ncbi:putative Beta-lactamase [Candidatus Zixiibacteriota bacterium]|nr:putative Beta-lactamase [candidate division Zixibacteria bacterium]
MMIILKSLILISLIISVQVVSAQESRDYSVKKIRDHIYELSYDAGGYPVKIIASVGNDGILLVDSGERERAEALKAKLLEMWKGAPAVIILTHEHIEHIGGNEIFGKSPLVIGHSSLRTRLKESHFLFDEYTEASLPDITFNDTLSLYFNGEEIRLISLAGGHSASDIMVWFTKSNVAGVQALCNWPHFPSIDDKNGDVEKYIADAGKTLALLPPDILIVPGHGEDCSMAEFQKFHDMLVQTHEIVKNELAAGKSMEMLQKEDVLKDFKGYEGGYTSANRWIKYLAQGIQKKTTDSRKELYEPLYYALRDKGIDSAIAEYYRLKKNHFDEYEFDETIPAIIGYKLFYMKKDLEAVRFFELSLKEYPRGVYAGLSYQLMAESYEKTGDLKLALKNYKELIKLNPADSAIAGKIKELEKDPHIK